MISIHNPSANMKDPIQKNCLFWKLSVRQIVNSGSNILPGWMKYYLELTKW